MANSPLSNLPTLTEWLKAHPGEHLLPAATVARLRETSTGTTGTSPQTSRHG